MTSGNHKLNEEKVFFAFALFSQGQIVYQYYEVPMMQINMVINVHR